MTMFPATDIDEPGGTPRALSDERKPKPKPNMADTRQPAEAAAPDTGPPEAIPAPEPPGPKKAAEPKPDKTKAGPKPAKRDPEPAVKLPRLGELQRQVLVALPTISVTELAERLDATRPSVSRALHGLKALGLVEPSDGQVGGWKSPWRLTRLGQHAASELGIDSLRRIHDLLLDRPRNLPPEAEAIMVDAEQRLGALL